MCDATLALIQHKTGLYLMDLEVLTREFAYQQASDKRECLVCNSTEHMAATLVVEDSDGALASGMARHRVCTVGARPEQPARLFGCCGSIPAFPAAGEHPQVLARFGSVSRVRLDPPAPLRTLLLLGLDMAEALGQWIDEDEELEDKMRRREEVCSLAIELLTARAPMLHEYFGLEITHDGCLAAVPTPIDQCPPVLERQAGWTGWGGMDGWKLTCRDSLARFRDLSLALLRMWTGSRRRSASGP